MRGKKRKGLITTEVFLVCVFYVCLLFCLVLVLCVVCFFF